MEKAIVNCKIKTFLTTGVISEKFENRQGTSITNWEARFGLRTVPETSGKAMDMEPWGRFISEPGEDTAVWIYGLSKR